MSNLITRSTHLGFVHTIRDDEAEWLRELDAEERRFSEFMAHAEAVIATLIASPPDTGR